MPNPVFLQKRLSRKRKIFPIFLLTLLLSGTLVFGFNDFIQRNTYACSSKNTIAIHRGVHRCAAPWFVVLALPTFLQSTTAANDAAASTSHPITPSSPIRSQGGAIGPSTGIVTCSFDGNPGATTAADSLGNTWTLATSTGSGSTYGAMFYCFNMPGGAPPTITITTANSVKSKLAFVEIDQVRPVAPLDRTVARVHTPAVASTSRTAADFTGGGAYTTKRRGMKEVIVAGMGWNDTRTTSNGANFTGTFSATGGSSNLGVAMSRSSAERQNIAPSFSVARFTMSASDTQPVSIMSVTFYRDGIVTSTDEDGCIQNIEGAVTVDTGAGAVNAFWTGNGVYKSSTSAPFGGTGASETDKAYAFFPDYSANLLPGVTIGSSISWVINCGTGSDDGSGFMSFFGSMYKNGTFGSTLTSDDDNVSPNYAFSSDLSLTIAGTHTFAVDRDTYYNTAGMTTAAIISDGDSMGFSSNTYAVVLDTFNNAPQYLELSLNYPVLSQLVDPVMTGGIIPFAR